MKRNCVILRSNEDILDSIDAKQILINSSHFKQVVTLVVKCLLYYKLVSNNEGPLMKKLFIKDLGKKKRRMFR